MKLLNTKETNSLNKHQSLMTLKTVILNTFLKDVTLKVSLDMAKILIFMINIDLSLFQKA